MAALPHNRFHHTQKHNIFQSVFTKKYFTTVCRRSGQQAVCSRGICHSETDKQQLKAALHSHKGAGTGQQAGRSAAGVSLADSSKPITTRYYACINSTWAAERGQAASSHTQTNIHVAAGPPIAPGLTCCHCCVASQLLTCPCRPKTASKMVTFTTAFASDQNGPSATAKSPGKTSLTSPRASCEHSTSGSLEAALNRCACMRNV